MPDASAVQNICDDITRGNIRRYSDGKGNLHFFATSGTKGFLTTHGVRCDYIDATKKALFHTIDVSTYCYKVDEVSLVNALGDRASHRFLAQPMPPSIAAARGHG
jgi:hypothetical protein